MKKYILTKTVKGKKYEYVVFGDYTLEQIQRVCNETGYYGEYYQYLYMERMRNPRRNEVTPGVGTQ